MNDALLPLLPSLVALVDEESVGRAAKRVGISQPRMSARLASLRAALEDPLLVAATGRRGLVATDRAKAIADAARGALTDLDAAVAGRVFDAARAKRTFSIMANDNAATVAGLPLAHAIRGMAGPEVRCALHQFDTARLTDLENGRVDLALGAPAQFERMPALMVRAIVRDRFVVAVRPGGVCPVDLDDYCNRNHVLVSGDGGGFTGLVDRALADRGRSRRVVLSVQSYLLAIEAVATDDLVATLPLSLLTASARNLASGEPPLSLSPFALVAAWHPRVDSDPSHRWLRDRLGELHRYRTRGAQRGGWAKNGRT